MAPLTRVAQLFRATEVIQTDAVCDICFVTAGASAACNLAGHLTAQFAPRRVRVGDVRGRRTNLHRCSPPTAGRPHRFLPSGGPASATSESAKGAAVLSTSAAFLRAQDTPSCVATGGPSQVFQSHGDANIGRQNLLT